ncbi:hypothetical protein GCM10009534_44910 [Kribbella sandramycini]
MVLRRLFDFNAEGAWGWAWFVARVLLLGLGSEAGQALYRLLTGADVGLGWFGERILVNLYLWATIIATALYSHHDRRRAQPS